MYMYITVCTHVYVYNSVYSRAYCPMNNANKLYYKVYIVYSNTI